MLQESENQLEELPQPPSGNPLGEVLKLIDAFKKDLSERVEGTPGADGLLQKLHRHTAKFRRRIYASAPCFVPWENDDDDEDRTMPEATFLSNEEESESDDKKELGKSDPLRRICD